MPTDVFRAADATLVLASDDTQTAEGVAAGDVITRYDLSNAVGRLTGLTITVTSDVQPFYEIGRRYPGQLRPGLVGVAGRAERAHVNGALLQLLLGAGAGSPPATPLFVQPAFNVIATLRDVAAYNPLTFIVEAVRGISPSAASFSRSSAPPRPLIRSRLGATSSAPSMVTSGMSRRS